jgi:hypothetical protein
MAKNEIDLKKIVDLSSELNYICKNMQSSIRIEGSNGKNLVRIDFFLLSKRYHNLITNQRGNYNNVEEFITNQFNNL